MSGSTAWIMVLRFDRKNQMLPLSYSCSGCKESFQFNVREACYYVGIMRLDKRVADADLLMPPVRPAWCKDCDSVCIVEDIAPLRAFENAYGAVKSGKSVEYPTETECMEPAVAETEIKAFLHWRMGRRHPARALCCGGSNFQFMDVAHPLLKHADCDFGVIESSQSHVGPYNWSGPGINSPANIRLYDTEGTLIGLLTWRNRDDGTWAVEAMSYAPLTDD
jgi:hypothetical protein